LNDDNYIDRIYKWANMFEWLITKY
jgi:hypothetical protein